jgi:hypothetical protein
MCSDCSFSFTHTHLFEWKNNNKTKDKRQMDKWTNGAMAQSTEKETKTKKGTAIVFIIRFWNVCPWPIWKSEPYFNCFLSEVSA